jgi:Ca2+-binding RTX toxin-like protein
MSQPTLPVAEPLERRLLMDRSWVPPGVDANNVYTIAGTPEPDVIDVFIITKLPGVSGTIDLTGDAKDDVGKICIWEKSGTAPGFWTVIDAADVTPSEFVIYGRGGDDYIAVDEVPLDMLLSIPLLSIPTNQNGNWITQPFSIDAGDGNDTVLASQQSDTVWGGIGRDWLDGDRGDDVVQGEQGRDTVWGGPGIDLLAGGKGDDFIDGDDGRWTVQLSSMNMGASEADTITAGRGADTLVGSLGDDMLVGGRGNDTFVANARFNSEYGGWLNTSYGEGNTGNRARVYGGGGFDTAFVDGDMEWVTSSVESVGVVSPPASLLYPLPGVAR